MKKRWKKCGAELHEGSLFCGMAARGLRKNRYLRNNRYPRGIRIGGKGYGEVFAVTTEEGQKCYTAAR